MIKLWDLATKQEVRRLGPATAPLGVVAISFSPDGKMLAAACDTSLILWNLETQLPIWTRETHAPLYIKAVAFSPDGKALVSGGGESPKMKVWDVASGDELQRFPSDHTGTLLKAVFAPGGQVLGTIGGDNRLLLWDFAERRLRAELPFNFNSPAVAFSNDGRLVADGATPSAIRVWEVESGRPVALLHGHGAGITSLAFTPDGSELVSASRDHTVRLWGIKAFGGEDLLKGHRSWVAQAAFSPDGRLLASTEMFPPVQTLVWNVASRRIITNLFGHTGPIGSPAFSADGRILATGSFDRTVMLWDAESWRLIGVLTNTFESVSLAFSPKDNVLAVGGLMGAGDERPEFKISKRLNFWDVLSRSKLNLLPEAAVGAAAVTFSDDGRLFATSHFDGSVRIWNFTEAKLVKEFPKEHRNVVWTVAFSRNSRLLASSGDDGKIVVYDVKSLQVLTKFEANAGFVWSVAFAPDNRTLASGGDDGKNLAVPKWPRAQSLVPYFQARLLYFVWAGLLLLLFCAT